MWRELPVAGLLALEARMAFWDFRGPAPIFVWTPVPTLKAWVLNLFAPRDHVFWSLGQYQALRRAERDFVLNTLGERAVKHGIGGLRRELDQRLHHIPIWERFGLLTAAFEGYFPYSDSLDSLHLRTGRHFSLAVPSRRRGALHAYFLKQWRQLGADALRACKETVFLASSKRMLDDPLHIVLGMPADQLDARGRARAQAEIARVGEQLARHYTPDAVGWLYAYSGEISLTPPPQADTRLVRALFEILRFRARAACALYRLPMLERLREDLTQPGWAAWPRVRGELAGVIAARLAPYDFIDENPFQARRDEADAAGDDMPADHDLPR